MTTQTKELKEITINEHVYGGQYIPASEAVVIAYQLASILGGNSDIKPLIASGDDNLIFKILAHTTRDKAGINKANFDKIYTGNLGELIQALQFVVEENFGDFLQGNSTGLLDVLNQKVTAKL
jgi:hypothetical protein